MNIAKHYRIEIGEVSAATILLVGCGGTGSFAALHLARLAWAARQRGLDIGLVFVDPDHVEEKNVGRQNFCPAEIGQPKALALASRYGLAFGLAITAVKGPFRGEMLTGFRRKYGQHMLVVGAVDSPAARRSIHRAMLEDAPRPAALTWWLDAGNSEYAGQVLLGNSGRERPLLSPLGVCTMLPLPGIQEPGLIEGTDQAPVDRPGLSCAELLALDAQSLMINQAMAGWLGVYAYRLLLGRDLDLMGTYLDLAGGVARSLAITEGEMERTEELPEAVNVAAMGLEALTEADRREIAEEERDTCPECGHVGLLEGRDVIIDAIGEDDIIYCPMCEWRMYLDDWQEQREEIEDLIAETE